MEVGSVLDVDDALMLQLMLVTAVLHGVVSVGWASDSVSCCSSSCGYCC